jgi:erythromycin esterase-like protein
MNSYNQTQLQQNKTGFFGLDVYCLWESMAEMKPYLSEADASVQTAVQKVHNCFQPYSADAYQYAQAVRDASVSCRQETHRLWESVQKLTSSGTSVNERQFVLQQNALVALNGENYYRTMVTDNAESWNIRDRHMAQTLDRLLNLHGKGSKAIVWEHNTHVGDAKYTDMSRAGQTNVGELVRKKYGEKEVFIVGFGSYQGTVIASDAWGGAIQKMEVPPAMEGSWEALLHALSPTNKIILSKDMRNDRTLNTWMGHRAIGVVYNPKREQYGNYVPSVVPRRYDAFIFIDQSTALHPLQTPVNANEPPDTYPWGY